MSDSPLIEVTQSATGIDYRLRTSMLTTQEYGVIFATLAQQIGEMMHREGMLDPQLVVTQIVLYMLRELGTPTVDQSGLRQLQ